MAMYMSKLTEKLRKDEIQKDISFLFCGILTGVDKDTNKTDSYIDFSLPGSPVDSISSLSSKVVEQVPYLIHRKYSRQSFS